MAVDPFPSPALSKSQKRRAESKACKEKAKAAAMSPPRRMTLKTFAPHARGLSASAGRTSVDAGDDGPSASNRVRHEFGPGATGEAMTDWR